MRASEVKSTIENRDDILLSTERLIIKCLNIGDITSDYISGLNDSEVNRYLDVKREKQTYDTVKSFILSNRKAENNLLFGVFKKDNKDLIGTIRILNISNFHFYADIGICLFKKEIWCKGFALEALLKVKEFAFNDLNMHFLESGVYGGNIASQKLFTRAGFELYLKIDNKYRFEDKFVETLRYKAINRNFDFNLLKN